MPVHALGHTWVFGLGPGDPDNPVLQVLVCIIWYLLTPQHCQQQSAINLHPYLCS
jgi:hypothetical protein